MSHVKLKVSVPEQHATLYIGGVAYKTYIISTGKNGTGFVFGSGCTPTGRLRVAEKFGDGMELGTVFVDRVPTGAVWKPGDEGDNLILTRILWLEGAEQCNANTKEREIYLHGTRNEHKLGTPNSAGCIVFANKDIVEVFDLMQVGDEVEVVG